MPVLAMSGVTGIFKAPGFLSPQNVVGPLPASSSQDIKMSKPLWPPCLEGALPSVSGGSCVC